MNYLCRAKGTVRYRREAASFLTDSLPFEFLAMLCAESTPKALVAFEYKVLEALQRKNTRLIVMELNEIKEGVEFKKFDVVPFGEILDITE